MENLNFEDSSEGWYFHLNFEFTRARLMYFGSKVISDNGLLR